MTSVAGEYSNIEYVFEPHSAALPNLREYATALWERRQFMVALADADLRMSRSSTKFGSIWGVLDPLFQAAIYFFLYVVLRKGASNQSQFLPVLIGGFYLFGLTLAAVGEAGTSIKKSRSLMLNSTFPRALLPMTAIYKSVRRSVPSAFVFIVLFPLLGGRFGAGFLVLPLLFAVQMVMNIGIALLMSTFVTLIADASLAITYVTRILMFATPVVYPVALLPASARVLIGWQPLFPLFASYQAVLSGGVPNPLLVLQAAGSAFALLVVGGWVFLSREREFAIHV